MKSSRVSTSILILLPALFVFVVLAGLRAGTPGYAAAQPGFKLGVYLDNPADLAGFEANIGRQTDMFLWYQSIGESLDTADLLPIAQAGRTIQLSWEPRDFAGDPVNQPAYRLKNIARGDFDADIRRWAREMRDFGYPIRIRPMCEMNGNWTSWSGTVNGNSPEDYIPAWRHIHDIFVQEGATNVKWVWSPNRDGDTTSAQNTFDTYYPGDNYVDFIGINGYNWGSLYNTPEWTSSWQDLNEVFGYSYDVFTSRTNKPVMISETASTEVGGDKAQWITSAFAQLPVRFPRIESITWFNTNKETDWRVESSPASLEAFRAAVAGADHTPPTVRINSPVDGATLSGNVTVSLDAFAASGVSQVELYAGGRLVGTKSAAPYNFTLMTRALADGTYDLIAKAYDTAGNLASSQITVNVNNSTDSNYYFGWYDSSSAGMNSWVIIGNPSSVAQNAEVYIGGVFQGSYNIGPGGRVTPMFAGVIGGPVKVVSTSGGELLVSERTIYNGSFSELPAVSMMDLSTDHYLAWYDERTPGMRAWIVVGNQGSQPAEVDIFIAGQVMGHYTVPAGGRVTPEFKGVMDGPVRVTSTNGQPLTVSERVVYANTFNETTAKPAQSLASEHYFTWYDSKTPGMLTWIVVGNQGTEATNVDIYIAGKLMGRYYVPAGGRITPIYPGTMNGPVRVISVDGQPLIASQRSVYYSSFEEVTANSAGGLASNQWFAWYDSASPGMTTWILVGNQGQTKADVDIKIGGRLVGRYQVPAGGRITPVFQGQINGPVEISATSSSQLVVSQRVIYYGSFDEVLGRALT